MIIILRKQELEELAQMKAAAEKATLKTNEPIAASKASTSQIDKDAKKRERQIRRTVEELETKIGRLSEKISSIEAKLCEPEIFKDHEQVMKYQTELDTIKSEHDELEMQWLELNDELENIISS